MTKGRTVTFNARQANELAAVLRGLLSWIAFGRRDAHDDLARNLHTDAHYNGGPLDTPEPLESFTALVDAYYAILDPGHIDADHDGPWPPRLTPIHDLTGSDPSQNRRLGCHPDDLSSWSAIHRCQ